MSFHIFHFVKWIREIEGFIQAHEMDRTITEADEVTSRNF